MANFNPKTDIFPFLAGALVAALALRGQDWWLNSSTGVARMTLVQFGAATLLALLPSSSPWSRGGYMVAGATFATAIALFVRGPGTIWPIVIVIGSVLISIAVMAGTSLGMGIRLGVSALVKIGSKSQPH